MTKYEQKNENSKINQLIITTSNKKANSSPIKQPRDFSYMSITPSSIQQQLILLRQKVFELTHELQLTKIHNQNLISQVAELKQKQQQQKQLNDMLVNNLKNSQQQITDQITLNINGEFLTKRIHELEQQLEKYRSGVSESVDRRVKKIVGEYTQEKQLQYEKKKSRLSMGPRPTDNSRKYFQTHEHKYYNIEYKTYSQSNSRQNTLREQFCGFADKKNYLNKVFPQDHETQSICSEYQVSSDRSNSQKPHQNNKSLCENCFELQRLINEKEQIIHKLNEQLRLLQEKLITQGSGEADKVTKGNSNNTSTDEWKLKYLQTLKLYENLKQNHDQLLDEFNHLAQTQSNQKYNSNQQSYTITHSPINGFKKKTITQANPCQSRLYQTKDRQQLMLQQITNLVNGMGRAKKPQSKQNQYPQHKHIFIQQNNKSRLSYTNGASRISQGPKLDGSQFTIKQGVNRYGQGNGLF